MLCLEDCLDFCDLETAEIEAIATHEHLPLVVAAEMGCELLKSPAGVERLHHFILEDMQLALEHGQPELAGHWAQVYCRFERSHPLA